MITGSLCQLRVVPIATFAVVIAAITLMIRFLPSEFVFPLAAAIMFGVPFLLKGEVKGLRWNGRGVLIGISLSIVLLLAYLVLCVYVLDKPVRLSNISSSIIIQHLLLVAVPEEVFFRGYLQEEVGNNVRAILIVSALFAIGHLVTRCLGMECSGSAYLENILTFFPSLAMGFMYFVSGTLWANIIFHFLANIVYIASGGL